MARLLGGCNQKNGELASSLKALLDDGFAWKEGCLVLKSQLKLRQPEVSSSKTRLVMS